MDDGYIPSKRQELMENCPICGSEIRPKPNDPLMQIYECINPDCEAKQIDPTISIYACTICDADTMQFSDIDDHPYCFKHMPSKIVIREENNAKSL